ncbi:response regulator transcription factor [Vulcaniibacterium gelatinicum]|uniref:response regulator transcription factor n=1 Tax=Vulcaniibacterium gelatinicum TaxID=2598725 RepID=UPI0011CBE472|nr:response regulator transcription factor [Vulcaniibacterium gelatinicum]
MTVQLLIADDHPIVCEGLRLLFEAQSDLRVVGTAGDGPTAVAEAERLRPDVVVMDFNMPGLDGIEACRRIRAALPGTRVLMLSMHGSSEHVFRALQAGADGYVLKESVAGEVVAAVRTVFAGRRYLGRGLEWRIEEKHGESPLDRLSPRERQVLQLLAAGRSNPEIATLLSLSVKSVETYRSRLLAKLGIESLAGLVRFAIEHGLAPTGPPR